MNISPSRAFSRWFLIAFDVFDEFFKREKGRSGVEKGTNLCFYFQVSVLGALVILLHLAVVAAGFTIIFVLPAWALGMWYWLTWGTITLVTLAIYGSCRLIIRWRRNKARKRQAEFYPEAESEEEAIFVPGLPEPGPSFFQIVWEWLVAMKQRFCPPVHWTEKVPLKRSKVAANFILQYDDLALASFIVGGILFLVSFGVPWLVVELRANFSVVSEQQCTFENIEAEGAASVVVNLQCGDQKAWAKDASVVAYLANNHGATLSCVVYADGEASCNVSE